MDFELHFSNFLALKRATFQDFMNTICQGLVATPFRIITRAVFAFSLRLPFGQFTYPDTHGSMKKYFKNFCPEREGVAAKINKFL